MSTEISAILAIAVLAAIIGWTAYREIRRSPLSPCAWLCGAIARLVSGVLYRQRANRCCPFPVSGAAIVIANHCSPVDPLLLFSAQFVGCANPRPRVIGFMMAREYFELRGLRWIAAAMESIPVDRQGKDMAPAREALERLKQGRMLGVFPEGRLNPGADLLEADTGVAWLALRSRAPVYPVFIQGSPRGDSMVMPFFAPSHARMIYGDPIDLSSYYDQRRSHAVLVEVTDLMMRGLAELGGVRYAKDVAAILPSAPVKPAVLATG